MLRVAFVVALATTACIPDLAPPDANATGGGGVAPTAGPGGDVGGGAGGAGGGGIGGVTCPPAGSSVNVGALSAIASANAGCLTNEAAAFVMESACSCASPAAACPPIGCPSPEDQCPGAVPAAASCLRLSGATSENCVCRCADCLRTCDGTGPVFAHKGAGSHIFYSANINPQDLPSSGRMGVYIRARGRFSGLIVSGQPPITQPPVSEAVFGDVVVNNVAMWGNPQEKPSTIAIGKSGSDILAQIDCVAPFVSPP